MSAEFLCRLSIHLCSLHGAGAVVAQVSSTAKNHLHRVVCCVPGHAMLRSCRSRALHTDDDSGMATDMRPELRGRRMLALALLQISPNASASIFGKIDD